MAKQSLLRIIKRWRRYMPRADWAKIPRDIRGLYVLYKSTGPKKYDVKYIGVSGLGERGRLKNRLRRHNKRIQQWTHFSFFEIHDNVTSDELRELETLLRTVFRHDTRIGLENIQLGSRKMNKLRTRRIWDGNSIG